jgi:hypothetical protein
MNAKRYGAAVILAAALPATQATAQGCRARQIMTSQCTWFALEELGGSRPDAARAEKEATSGLIDGCSPGEYQMVLLRGTGATQAAIQRLRARGVRDTAAVQVACAAEASRVVAR